jgi:hypothetical protein
MSEVDKHNEVLEWWEQRRKVLNRSIDEAIIRKEVDKDILEDMKRLLNNNIKIVERKGK